MYSYFIESFKITQLWGYRDIDLTFNSDVNILIGPNGSGKTTILALLHSIVSGDLQGILDIKFEQAEIKLRSFQGRSVRTVKVDITDGFLTLKVGQKEYGIDTDIFLRRRGTQSRTLKFYERNPLIRNRLLEEIDDELTTLVPLVWLPISRRLPVTEYEEEPRIRRRLLESVDLRLEELLNELIQYHSSLNTQLSKRYKEFENQVLSVILYNKEHDQVNSVLSSIQSSLPTELGKDQLLQAFESAGLLNKQMQSKIDNHFAVAEELVGQIRESQNFVLELEDIIVLTLISRTSDMVEYARELEKDKNNIFAPLQRYEKTVNSFLNGKSVAIDDNGNLKIKFSSTSDLDPRDLSSGEKQILILLTQALLRIDEPVVYIADEPELSLHVTWQEKLLESLGILGGDIQVIVATHSPDIVGNFLDKVIDLGGGS